MKELLGNLLLWQLISANSTMEQVVELANTFALARKENHLQPSQLVVVLDLMRLGVVVQYIEGEQNI